VIITITLNPAIDQTLVLDELVLGDTNRVRESRTDPGGKGINVSRALRELGWESLAMGFVSGGLGRFIEHTLDDLGIFNSFIHTPGQTRTNITLVEHSRDIHTTISERGPVTQPRHVSKLIQSLKRHLRPGNWLVLAGSIPPAISPGIYRDLICLAREHSVRTVVDADGEALAHCVEARPFMIKQNRRELQRLMGRELADEAAIIEAAKELHVQGVEVVIVSQGSDGAIAVGREGTWRAVPPEIKPVSAVGSGDSLVAGVVLTLSRGHSLPEALRLGIAAGTATALAPGTQLCRRSDVERLLPLVNVSKLPE